MFLGPDAELSPETVHFYRDRMAERYDFSRAVTDGRWYYIRNFMPHRPRGRDSWYGYQVQANRIMAAQALGLCGDPNAACEAIREEAVRATDGYVFLQALNAFQYSHTDDRLKRADWKAFGKKKAPAGPGLDNTGWGYARRIIQDALQIWPVTERSRASIRPAAKLPGGRSPAPSFL